MSPAPAPLRPQLLAAISPLLKQACRVELRAPAPDDPPSQPRYAGDPARDTGAPWPACGTCAQPLSFLAQFPAMGRFWRVFLCESCSPWSDEDRRAGQLVIEHDPLDGKPSTRQPAPAPSPWREQAWDLFPVSSPPLLSDEESLSVPLPATYRRWLEEQESQEDLAHDDTAPVFASWGAWSGVGTQLGGYAHFIQSPPELPDCPHCLGPLELLARLDSEDDVGLMWGDLGAAYLHACPRHPSVVHFEMQCF